MRTREMAALLPPCTVNEGERPAHVLAETWAAYLHDMMGARTVPWHGYGGGLTADAFARTLAGGWAQRGAGARAVMRVVLRHQDDVEAYAFMPTMTGALRIGSRDHIGKLSDRRRWIRRWLECRWWNQWNPVSGDAPMAAVPKLLKPLTMYVMLRADMYARQLLPRQWEDMLPDLEWPAGWVPTVTWQDVEWVKRCDLSASDMSWVAAQWWIHRGRPQTLLERHAAAAAYLRHVQASLGDDRHAVCTLWRAACILAHAEELPDVLHANDLMANGVPLLDKQQASQLELTPHHALRDLLGMLDVASLGRLALSCAAFGAPCRGVSWYGQQPDLSYSEAAIRSRCGDATYLRTLRPGRSAGPRLLSVHGRRRYTNALHAQELLRPKPRCRVGDDILAMGRSCRY